MSKKTFTSLQWFSRFLDETPGDEKIGGLPRQVPNVCWSRTKPTPSPSPKLHLWSDEMAEELGIEHCDEELLAGNRIVEGMDPYAQRYGGHQFGNWAHQLGDGRAITLGEASGRDGILELQLKGAGQTPYSRFADGKAVLRSSIREFLCSEAMHHLGIPTTRALSLVTTGESVIRDMMYDGNPKPEPGAIVCRVAQSFLRFGSFQIHTNSGDIPTLKTLVDHTVKHHFPTHSTSNDEGLIAWLKEIAENTAIMIAHWMRVGFVHGVMNTDNMSIHGLTIDYGPYGWLEDFNPDWTPNTTDSSTRRYRYGHQPQIGAWNIARLLEAIGPLIEDKERLYEVLDDYYNSFERENKAMWAAKIGLEEFSNSDEELIGELIQLLQKNETDMTIFFRLLCHIKSPEIQELEYSFYDSNTISVDSWNTWLDKWWKRTDKSPNREKMLENNPKYVLRNWMAQLAIDEAEKGDYSVAKELYELLKNPYDEQSKYEDKWFQKRPEWAKNRVGCSMLSCSS